MNGYAIKLTKRKQRALCWVLTFQKHIGKRIRQANRKQPDKQTGKQTERHRNTM